MISVSTGQCTFEGASRAEHAERQAIYVERLGASVRRCYRRHEVKIEERRDDGALSVTVSHLASEPFDLFVGRGPEQITSRIRQLSGEAWQYACRACLYRVGGHGRAGRPIDEVFRSAPAAVDAAKRSLGYGAKRVGIARLMADGTIGVYRDRAEMLRDETGEHAAYTISRLPSE